MNKLVIVAAAVPILSLGIGFGVGTVLNAPEGVAEPAAVTKTDHARKEAAALIDAAQDKTHAQDTAEPHKSESKAADHAAEAKPEAAHAANAPAKKSGDIVKLGQITVPIYKPMSVTYVVADLGVAMRDSESAARYRVAENATRLRDNILSTFREATENPKMRRAAIDSDWLSKTLTDNLRSEFDDASEVLFLSLFKKDVPRS